jgi:hypothetical protein
MDQADRKAPPMKATQLAVGSRLPGQDQMLWEVVQTRVGNRWRRVPEPKPPAPATPVRKYATRASTTTTTTENKYAGFATPPAKPAVKPPPKWGSAAPPLKRGRSISWADEMEEEEDYDETDEDEEPAMYSRPTKRASRNLPAPLSVTGSSKPKTLTELRQLARMSNIRGYSQMSKEALQNALWAAGVPNIY